jgi:Protein of unknown function (DUF3999)
MNVIFEKLNAMGALKGGFLLCLGFASSLVFALNKDEFALEIPLKNPEASQGSKALLSVDLPMEVYRATRRPGLADVRVVNAAAEAVPYALNRPSAIQEQPVFKYVALLPFYGPLENTISGNAEITLSKKGDDVSLTISPAATKQGNGRVLNAYYADLKADVDPNATAKRVLQSIHLKLSGSADVLPDLNASMTIESSDDLKTWRELRRGASIFRLSRGTQVLSNLSIDIGAEVGRYLRVTSAGKLESLPMTEIALQFTGNSKQPLAQVVNLVGVTAPKPAKNTFHYDAGVSLPITRFNLKFADLNTIAPVKVSARQLLTQPWELLKTETLYRMSLGVNSTSGSVTANNEDEGRNTDISFSGGAKEYRYWQVEIDERAGEFGARIPSLQLGFIPVSLVFAARGAAPFSLLAGNAQIQSQALDMAALVPLDAAGRSMEVGKVTLDLTRATSRPGLGEKVVDTSAEDRKKWILWASLVLGVGGLGFFASRLLKEPKK